MAAAVTEENVEKTVLDALPQFVDVDPSEISRDSKFEDLDVDSLDLAELSQIVEDEYGVKFNSSDVEQLKTVGNAIDLIVARS